MPLNNFYTHSIVSSTDESLEVEVTIDPKHAIFEGHFPDQPVTPGVVLVEMARSILSQQLSNELMLVSAREIKFTAPVIPSENTTFTLKVDYKLVEGNYKSTCIYSAADKIFTKIKGVFSAS